MVWSYGKLRTQLLVHVFYKCFKQLEYNLLELFFIDTKLQKSTIIIITRLSGGGALVRTAIIV